MQELAKTESAFISDLHIQSEDERNGEILLRFFCQCLESHSLKNLFLLGDIFDVWVGKHKIFEKRFANTLSLIDEMVRKGIRLHYFEGNHDLHLYKAFREDLGVILYRDIAYVELNGIKFRLEHGDFINQNDQAYLNWRETARALPLTMLSYYLPGKAWDLFAQNYSKNSRKKNDSYQADNAEELREMIRTYAQNESKSHDFDVVVTGHMHIRDDFSFTDEKGKVRRSINLGSWLDKPGFLSLVENELSFHDI
jgi:UDP-2,3-diacylglucosamine hydrolase